MVERSLCMREVPGPMPGSSIYLYEENYDSIFKASTITTKITVNLNSQSTLFNGFLYYCNVLFIYYLFTKMISSERNLNQLSKDTLSMSQLQSSALITELSVGGYKDIEI